MTVCVSRLRAEELRALVPEAAARIHHVPHGAPTPFLAEHRSSRPAEPPADLAQLPRPYLGYIGSLEDRVDWELMDRLSRTFPTRRSSWWAACAMPSPSPGGRPARGSCHGPTSTPWAGGPRRRCRSYYQSFDVCLIPYRIDHPFNRACNPTKIMDAMGSGRPIVATAIPECRLHAERFHVAENDDEFIERGPDDPGPAFRRRPRGAAARLCPGQHLPRDRRADPRPDRPAGVASRPADVDQSRVSPKSAVD